MSRRTIVAVGAAIALAVALAGCSSTSTASAPSSAGSSSKDEITLATDANYPPCESYKEGTKELVGFEPELWNAIAEKTGQKITVVNTDFDSLIPGVQSGRYDVAMECISDNAERQKQVTFLDFVYAENSVITTAKYEGPIDDSDPLSICGQTMGAQSGFDVITTVQDDINPKCTSDGKEPVKVQTYPSAAATYNALYSGRIDFVIQDTAAAALLNKTAPVKLVLHENSELPKYYLGIVFPKGDDTMLKRWQKGLDEVIADGTYDEILKKWDIANLALEPGVNLATKKPLS